MRDVSVNVYVRVRACVVCVCARVCVGAYVAYVVWVLR